MYKLKDIIASGGGNNKINKFINKYVLSKKEKKEIIKEIKENKGSNIGDSSIKYRYYKIFFDEETLKEFGDIQNVLQDIVIDLGIIGIDEFGTSIKISGVYKNVPVSSNYYRVNEHMISTLPFKLNNIKRNYISGINDSNTPINYITFSTSDLYERFSIVYNRLNHSQEDIDFIMSILKAIFKEISKEEYESMFDII